MVSEKIVNDAKIGDIIYCMRNGWNTTIQELEVLEIIETVKTTITQSCKKTTKGKDTKSIELKCKILRQWKVSKYISNKKKYALIDSSLDLSLDPFDLYYIFKERKGLEIDELKKEYNSYYEGIEKELEILDSRLSRSFH